MYVFGAIFVFFSVSYLASMLLVSEVYLPVFYRQGIATIYEVTLPFLLRGSKRGAKKRFKHFYVAQKRNGFCCCRSADLKERGEGQRSLYLMYTLIYRMQNGLRALLGSFHISE